MGYVTQGSNRAEHYGNPQQTFLDEQCLAYERARLADGPYRVPEVTGGLAVSGVFAEIAQVGSGAVAVPEQRSTDSAVTVAR